MNAHDIEHFRAAETQLWQRYGVMPTEHFVALPTLNIQVRVLEVGRGEPVLFVHGSPNAASKWAPLAARLTDFRCLLLDRPGCGLSEPVDYRGRDLRAFGRELLSQTLDGLQLPKASVVASSFGGALAFYFTHAYPERVTRLVQEGCPAFVEGFRVPFYNLVSSAIGLLFGVAPRSAAAFRALGHASSMAGGQFEAAVLVWRDALLKYTDTTRYENGLNRNIARHSREYRYGAEFLRQIKPATLYLWGEDDPFGGSAIAARSARAQDQATLQMFPASGHLPWLDAPEAHAQLIGEFLGRPHYDKQ
jgi:2-hydroxy-6-oxonona-2,4-dienedioate hydrolase